MDQEYAKYLLDKTRQDYNLIAEDFSRTRFNIWPEFNIFRDFIKDGDKILDVGCGNGRLIELFGNKKVDYTGIDISDGLIKIARQRYPQNRFLAADAKNLPFSDGYFDAVFSIAVLHHIPSRKLRLAALREMKRVLRPGGFLITTAWDLWRKKDIWQSLVKFTLLKIFGRSRLDFRDILEPWRSSRGEALAHRYFHLFTKTEMVNLAREVGFKIKKVGLLKKQSGKGGNIYLVAEA